MHGIPPFLNRRPDKYKNHYIEIVVNTYKSYLEFS